MHSITYFSPGSHLKPWLSASCSFTFYVRQYVSSNEKLLFGDKTTILEAHCIKIHPTSSVFCCLNNELVQSPNPWEQYNHSLMSCIRTSAESQGIWRITDQATGPTCYPKCSHNRTSGFNGNKTQFVWLLFTPLLDLSKPPRIYQQNVSKEIRATIFSCLFYVWQLVLKLWYMHKYIHKAPAGGSTVCGNSINTAS